MSDRGDGQPRRCRRRVRVAVGVYQRCDQRTGRPQAHKFEYTYRDATGRQVWQTAQASTKTDAKIGRAELLAAIRLGQRVERTSITVGDAAAPWLARGTGKHGAWEPSTKERYERIVRRTILTSADGVGLPIGRVKVREHTVDRVAEWSRRNEYVLAPTTASIALVTLNQVCRYAARQGWLANPVARLEAGERPRWQTKPVGILQGEDLRRVLEHGGPYRPLFEFLAFSGLRIGEALGLRWDDVDHGIGVIRVRQQLSRHRTPKRLKTEAGRRDVVLSAAATAILRQRREASDHLGPDDLVFCTAAGRGLDYRKVGEGFRAAVKASGVTIGGRVSLHSLRHGFALLLIAHGLNVVFVSRQLGHTKPTTTLGVYAHLYAQADHAATARGALDASYDAIRPR
jgi:integrase